MRDMYHDEVEERLRRFHKKCTDKNVQFAEHKSFFESIMHASNIISSNNIDATEVEFNAVKDELCNHIVEKTDTMRSSILHSMELLYRQMRRIIEQTCRTSMTKSRCIKYNRFVNRENHDEIILEQNGIDIEKANTLLADLKEERRVKQAETMRDFIGIKREKAYFLECFLTLRNRYEIDMKGDQKMMRSLMDHTYKSITVIFVSKYLD